MAIQKPLMELPRSTMADLEAGPAAGMSFYLFQSANGIIAALEEGTALPFFSDPQFYSLDDLLNGEPLPDKRLTTSSVKITSVFSSPHHASLALATMVSISPKYLPYATGAIPLVATYTLKVDTVFYRYVSSIPDHRYSGGHLRAGTYLTSFLDIGHANTGFGAVGRFALPLPVPTSHVIDYEIKAGTLIEVGTVSPLYGQSGGGVEIHLPANAAARQIAVNPLPAF